MSDPYLGEIRVFSCGYAPQGWAQCNGQLLPINQYQALFSLLGTTYGGDGMRTFALPNLTGRVPVHFGNNISLGQLGGEETHVLVVQELPQHSHQVMASDQPSDQVSPQGHVWGSKSESYSAQPNAAMNTASVVPTGGGVPHPNMQPYTVVNFCIALSGVYPSHN